MNFFLICPLRPRGGGESANIASYVLDGSPYRILINQEKNNKPSSNGRMLYKAKRKNLRKQRRKLKMRKLGNHANFGE